MTIPLVPLRIPGGWIVLHNIFTEVSPEAFINDEHEHRWEYNEDLLQIKDNNGTRLIDLGWYPEFKAEGQYRLVMLQQYEDEEDHSKYWNFGEPIIAFSSRSINEIKLKIEEILIKVIEKEM